MRLEITYKTNIIKLIKIGMFFKGNNGRKRNSNMPIIIIDEATLSIKQAPCFQTTEAKREFYKWKNSHLIEENRPVSEEQQRSFLNKP